LQYHHTLQNILRVDDFKDKPPIFSKKNLSVIREKNTFPYSFVYRKVKISKNKNQGNYWAISLQKTLACNSNSLFKKNMNIFVSVY
jgi:adenine specific DNA methylase Mod